MRAARPAYQRLHTDDPSGRQIGQRLIVGLQILALDRAAQFRLQLQPLDGGGAHRVIEDGIARPATILRAVERDVGATQQLGRLVVTDDTQGDADAGGDNDVMLAL